MTTECAVLLANPHPCAHIVYPYVDENHVEQAVSLFAGGIARLSVESSGSRVTHFTTPFSV
jgi:hypothetical protein